MNASVAVRTPLLAGLAAVAMGFVSCGGGGAAGGVTNPPPPSGGGGGRRRHRRRHDLDHR